MHTSTWAGQTATLVIEDGTARIVVDGEHVAYIHINDRSLWTSLLDPTEREAAIMIQDDTALYTTLDGAYALARLGVRLYHEGNQIVL